MVLDINQCWQMLLGKKLVLATWKGQGPVSSAVLQKPPAMMKSARKWRNHHKNFWKLLRAVSFVSVCPLGGKGTLKSPFSAPNQRTQLNDWLETSLLNLLRWFIPKSQLFQYAGGCITDCYQPSWAAPASSSAAQILERFPELCLHRKYLCLPTRAAPIAPEQWHRKGDKRISWVVSARLSNKKNQTVKLI